MKFNVNHPTFIAFLESINNTLLGSIKINNYFKITPEKKFAIQYMVLKQMKNSVKTRKTLNKDETISFINLLQSKNESIENYELAQLLKDLSSNYDKVNNFVKPVRKSKTIKLDKTQNDGEG